MFMRIVNMFGMSTYGTLMAANEEIQVRSMIVCSVRVLTLLIKQLRDLIYVYNKSVDLLLTYDVTVRSKVIRLIAVILIVILNDLHGL